MYIQRGEPAQASSFALYAHVNEIILFRRPKASLVYDDNNLAEEISDFPCYNLYCAYVCKYARAFFRYIESYSYDWYQGYLWVARFGDSIDLVIQLSKQ